MMAPLTTVLASLTILSLGMVSSSAKFSGERCEFEGRSYSPGETWFPDILPPGCTTCTCSKRGGHVRCESIQCPRLDCLVKEVQPGDCCPTCKDNLPPKLGVPTVPPSYAVCYHNGELHLHGDSFPSSSSGVIPQSENQCTLCTCWNGRVLCRLKTCPRLLCADPITVPGDCCQSCEDGEEIEEPSLSTPSTDCRYLKTLYKHGEQWLPRIGKLKCIVCRCNNSNIDCEKMSCPDTGQPCDKQCCNICPGRDSDSDRRACYYVYRQSSRRNYSVAFENKQTQTTEIHTWTIQSGYATSYETVKVEGLVWPREDALGVVRTRQYKRFKKRIMRQMKRCKASCSRKLLQRQVRRLRKSLISTDDVTVC